MEQAWGLYMMKLSEEKSLFGGILSGSYMKEKTFLQFALQTCHNTLFLIKDITF